MVKDGINQCHNGYLEVYVNLGWMGPALLAVVIATGYRRIVPAVRQDSAAGKLRLAYFVVALIYNFTEAGFKMVSPAWIFFLLAVMVVPKAPVPDSAPPLGIDLTEDFAECEPQVDHALPAR